MKVKVFKECDEPLDKSGYCKFSLEDRINAFIRDVKVIDIKYQANGYASESGRYVIERALVMYDYLCWDE